MRLSWLPNALTIARCVFAVFVLAGFWQAGVSAETITQGLSEGVSAEETARHGTLQLLWYQFAFFARFAFFTISVDDEYLRVRYRFPHRRGAGIDLIGWQVCRAKCFSQSIHQIYIGAG